MFGGILVIPPTLSWKYFYLFGDFHGGFWRGSRGTPGGMEGEGAGAVSKVGRLQNIMSDDALNDI